MSKLLLLRYDTECHIREEIDGFLEKIVEVHRKYEIPATFFCTGKTLDSLEPDFAAFYNQVKDNPLFDLQDHSYSHIGLCYEAGKPVEALRKDYEKSFAAHERIFGKRPIGVSRCGTSCDGTSLSHFAATSKSIAEFEMMAELGVKMINSFVEGVDPLTEFTNYRHLGFPEIMGFPSGYADVSWLHKRTFGDPDEYILGEIEKQAAKGTHMPVILHDWCIWKFDKSKELPLVVKIAETARKAGYRMVTHIDCYRDKSLWQ